MRRYLLARDRSPHAVARHRNVSYRQSAPDKQTSHLPRDGIVGPDSSILGAQKNCFILDRYVSLPDRYQLNGICVVP